MGGPTTELSRVGAALAITAAPAISLLLSLLAVSAAPSIASGGGDKTDERITK